MTGIVPGKINCGPAVCLQVPPVSSDIIWGSFSHRVPPREGADGFGELLSSVDGLAVLKGPPVNNLKFRTLPDATTQRGEIYPIIPNEKVVP